MACRDFKSAKKKQKHNNVTYTQLERQHPESPSVSISFRVVHSRKVHATYVQIRYEEVRSKYSIIEHLCILCIRLRHSRSTVPGKSQLLRFPSPLPLPRQMYYKAITFLLIYCTIPTESESLFDHESENLITHVKVAIRIRVRSTSLEMVKDPLKLQHRSIHKRLRSFRARSTQF